MLLRVLQSIFQLEEAEIAGGVAPRLLTASYWRGFAYRIRVQDTEQHSAESRL
jgi:hypothetical protein